MPVAQLDPELIRSDASSGAAKKIPDAIDQIIGKINEVIAAGGGSGTAQVFRYSVTGSEGNPFPITLPGVRATANYNVQIQQAGPQANAFKDYRPLFSSFTTAGFNVECGAVPEADDVLLFTVEDYT